MIHALTHASVHVRTRIVSLFGVLALLIVFASGCSSSPEDLAAEMCDCIKEAGLFACAELSSEHREAISGNPEAAQAYAGTLMQCDAQP